MNAKDRIIISDTWGGATHRLQVSDRVLGVAMKEAVSTGLLPKNVMDEMYLKNWYAMQRVLEVAIQKAVDEGEWREEVP